MNKEEDSAPLFSKKRKLSRFLAQEMLYDFVSDALDEERKKSVQDFLDRDEDLRTEEEHIRQAMVYCQSLSGVQISEPLSQQIGSRTQLWQIVVERLGWSNWPDPTKWLIEALGLSVLVAGVALFLPWEKLGFDSSAPDTQVVLLEKEKENDKVIATKSPPEDSTAEGKMAKAVKNKNAKVKTEIAKKIKEQKIATLSTSNRKQAKDSFAKQKAVEQNMAQKKKKVVKAAASGNAFLYRGKVVASDLDVATTALIEKLNSLGATKGGKVEIGWRKPNASYFHFVMGEEYFSDVKNAFSEHGKFVIDKTPHRRVMPAGKIRFIIEVKGATIN